MIFDNFMKIVLAIGVDIHRFKINLRLAISRRIKIN
ncbi:hypothetical protein SAMN05216464_11253 [Mucilaginibacter pineti]|uniref:Uncharacterized protein n=1 Tax=Mucilaginibacter pineti TaxID=1391627 RepID=A0A1G7HX89_9SPHI|nr:hypothetical protein SAMN05216464_11253 [Mucilaginibacter pineti]